VDFKHLQNLVEHLPMLGRDANAALEGAIGLEGQDNRRQLDCLWPRAEDDRHFHR
jgi:hypothetical protein